MAKDYQNQRFMTVFIPVRWTPVTSSVTGQLGVTMGSKTDAVVLSKEVLIELGAAVQQEREGAAKRSERAEKALHTWGALCEKSGFDEDEICDAAWARSEDMDQEKAEALLKAYL